MTTVFFKISLNLQESTSVGVSFLKRDSDTGDVLLFISSKKLFSFSRYSNFLFPYSHLFLPVGHCFRGWPKINLKVYDAINCQNKNLITHFVWYLEKEKRYDIETLSINRVLNMEHFYGNVMQKMCTNS